MAFVSTSVDEALVPYRHRKTAPNSSKGFTNPKPTQHRTERFVDYASIPETNETLREKVEQGIDLSDLDTSQVTDMTRLFRWKNNITETYGDITRWDTSSVKKTEDMFRDATGFDQDLSGWDMSNVTDIEDMFQDNPDFNNGGQPLVWNTSNVEDMNGVFRGATKFNQDISSWDTSKVRRFTTMFQDAKSFNQDISGWDTSGIDPLRNPMGRMFQDASAFDQDLSKWCVDQISEKPINFDVNAGFEGKSSKQPQWGNCPPPASPVPVPPPPPSPVPPPPPPPVPPPPPPPPSPVPPPLSSPPTSKSSSSSPSSSSSKVSIDSPPVSSIQEETKFFWNFTNWKENFFDLQNGAIYVYGLGIVLIAILVIWMMITKSPPPQKKGSKPGSDAAFENQRKGYIRKVAETDKDRKLFAMNREIENLERKKGQFRDTKKTEQSMFEKMFG